jgi:hypothetical protein
MTSLLIPYAPRALPAASAQPPWQRWRATMTTATAKAMPWPWAWPWRARSQAARLVGLRAGDLQAGS